MNFLEDWTPPTNPRIAEYWLPHVGAMADIVNGDLTLSEEGWLTVSTSPLLYNLYVDQTLNRVVPVVPKTEWRGRPYRFGFRDCVVLVAEWLDAEFQLGAIDYVKNISKAEYIRLNLDGYSHMFAPLGLVPVDDAPRHGDLLVYERDKHIGVCLNGDRVLHHLPNKYSSVDALDPQLVLGVYRAN